MDQLVRASGFDQDEIAAGQRQRFLDFHRHLVDPEKAFNDFFDVVGCAYIYHSYRLYWPSQLTLSLLTLLSENDRGASRPS
jgi:hypothetical protein